MKESQDLQLAEVIAWLDEKIEGSNTLVLSQREFEELKSKIRDSRKKVIQ